MNSLSAIDLKISELGEKNIHPWDKTVNDFFGEGYIFPSIDSISIPSDFDVETIIPRLKITKEKINRNVLEGLSKDVTLEEINKLPFLSNSGEYDKSKHRDYINLLQIISNIPKDELKIPEKSQEHSEKVLYEFLRIFG